LIYLELRSLKFQLCHFVTIHVFVLLVRGKHTSFQTGWFSPILLEWPSWR